ncbi:MAG: hypothetical protein IJ828_01295 [Treponema sp.]|nr:hypothetical protein [Treponema sp.]
MDSSFSIFIAVALVNFVVGCTGYLLDQTLERICYKLDRMNAELSQLEERVMMLANEQHSDS